MEPSTLISRYYDAFHASPSVVSRAPGRVNILGEHVDYNDGLVLPAAIDKAVMVAGSAREDECISILAADLNEQVIFQLSDLDQKIDLQGLPLPGWACYPAGVAWSLRNAGKSVAGIQVVFGSDVPIGAGLSSSAAVEVAFAVFWQAVGAWEMDRMELAKCCQQAENHYVGVSSGLMDQFASACGVDGHALVLDTRSLEWDAVPLPEGTALIIADSGVRRSLTHSGYNDRRRACEQAVAQLKQYLPEIQALRDVSSTEFAAYAPYLPDIPRMRAEHVIKEIQRVRSAISALNRQDTQALGALMYSSHNSLKNLYEVSTPELDTLVDLSRGLPGCIGSRLTGAGFGGCTINLVHENQADAFMQGLQHGYRQVYGKDASIYLCFASAGASIFSPEVIK